MTATARGSGRRGIPAPSSPCAVVSEATARAAISKGGCQGSRRCKMGRGRRACPCVCDAPHTALLAPHSSTHSAPQFDQQPFAWRCDEARHVLSSRGEINVRTYGLFSEGKFYTCKRLAFGLRFVGIPTRRSPADFRFGGPKKRIFVRRQHSAVCSRPHFPFIAAAAAGCRNRYRWLCRWRRHCQHRRLRDHRRLQIRSLCLSSVSLMMAKRFGRKW